MSVKERGVERRFYTIERPMLLVVALRDKLLQRFDCYLVDPASGHMLVSKIKPCMSKQKPHNGKAANGSLQQPSFLGSLNLLG